MTMRIVYQAYVEKTVTPMKTTFYAVGGMSFPTDEPSGEPDYKKMTNDIVTKALLVEDDEWYPRDDGFVEIRQGEFGETWWLPTSRILAIEPVKDEDDVD